MVALVDMDARVIGEQPLQPAIDIGGNRRLAALVDRDGSDGLQRRFNRAAFDLGRLNVGQPPLSRLDLHGELVERPAPRLKRAPVPCRRSGSVPDLAGESADAWDRYKSFHLWTLQPPNLSPMEPESS